MQSRLTAHFYSPCSSGVERRLDKARVGGAKPSRATKILLDKFQSQCNIGGMIKKFICLLACLAGLNAFAVQTVTLTWDAPLKQGVITNFGATTNVFVTNSYPVVKGYVVYTSTNNALFSFSNSVDVGNVTTVKLSGLPDGTNYFYVTAYTYTNGFNVEGPQSGRQVIPLVANEIFTIPFSGGVSVQFQSFLNHNYVIESTPSLTTPIVWTDLALFNNSTNSVLGIVITNPSRSQFYRLHQTK